MLLIKLFSRNVQHRMVLSNNAIAWTAELRAVAQLHFPLPCPLLSVRKGKGPTRNSDFLYTNHPAPPKKVYIFHDLFCIDCVCINCQLYILAGNCSLYTLKSEQALFFFLHISKITCFNVFGNVFPKFIFTSVQSLHNLNNSSVYSMILKIVTLAFTCIFGSVAGFSLITLLSII